MREQTATQLLAAADRVSQMTAFVGLDGFVDDILHVVDKRESADKYLRLPTIAQLAERLAAAAGRSTNVELVSQLTKLGGNGPIMANALASFGLKVTYLGILGYPNLHPVFADFAKRAEVHSIAEPGYTDALEFEDGKIMLGKHQSLKQMNWENIKSPVRPGQVRRQVRQRRPGRLRQLDHAHPHERHLGRRAQGDLPRHERPAPQAVH